MKGIYTATVNGGTPVDGFDHALVFSAMGQTSRAYRSMTSGLDGSIYVGVQSGDIYKLLPGQSNFLALGDPLSPQDWGAGMATSPNGDIFNVIDTGVAYGMYKQNLGIGNFEFYFNPSYEHYIGACTVDKNGSVYVIITLLPSLIKDVYKQLNGEGDFVALGLPNLPYQDLFTNSIGDIYLSVFNGDIYKSAVGTDNFIALGQTSRRWGGFCEDLDGNIFCADPQISTGNIYKQNNGVGDFISTNQIQRRYYGMATDLLGNIYSSVYNGDIYKYTPS